MSGRDVELLGKLKRKVRYKVDLEELREKLNKEGGEHARLR